MLGKSSPKGNILLLALLLLAGGIIGGLTVAVLVVGELRQSKALDSGIVAYHAAESAVEERLYAIRQQDICETGSCLTAPEGETCRFHSYGTINSCTSTNQPGCAKVSCERQYVTPSAEINLARLPKAQTFQLDLVASDNLTGVIVTWSRPSGVLPQDPLLDVAYVLPNPNPGSDPGEEEGLTQVVKLDAGIPYACSVTSGDACTALNLPVTGEPEFEGQPVYQVRIKALGTDVVNLTLTPVGGEEQFSSYLAVRAKGELSSTAQTVETSIPSQVPAYGFADYVIFSEADIVK